MSGQIHHADGIVPAEPAPLKTWFLAGTPEAEKAGLERLSNDLLAAHFPWVVAMLRFVGGSLLVGPAELSIVVRDDANGGMCSVLVPELSELLAAATGTVSTPEAVH